MRFRQGGGFGRFMLYIVVLTMLVGAFAVTTPEAFVIVPSDRDSEVVGNWYIDRSGSFRHYVFKEDGSGEIWVPNRPVRTFRWGTEEDRLRMKYQTQDGWSAPLYEFSTDPESGDLNLKAIESGYSMVMQKKAPVSATLQ